MKIEKLAKRKPTEILEDPRPQKYRNMEGFTDHVRNTMINFCSQSSQDLTLRYIFPAADNHIQVQWKLMVKKKNLKKYFNFK